MDKTNETIQKQNVKEEQESDLQSVNSVTKSTVAMSIATLSSRVTGLLRTWMMAFALGNTVITSAYQVANNMPNVIFDLVAGGLLGAAFIPIFMLEKERRGKKGGNEFACNILNLTIIILGVLSILATIFAPQVIATQTFTVEDTATVTTTAVMFFRIFAFQIVFYGISAVLTGILNGERIYFIPAFAPAINNIVVIAAFIAYAVMVDSNAEAAAIVLGIGTTLGVLVQAILQIPALKKTGFKWKPIVRLKDPALYEAIKIAIPTCIYVIGMLIAFTCRNAFSLDISEKGPSTILYAWTWFQLPYGVIAVSLSRTMFTEMSDSSAKNDIPALKSQLNFGISSTLMLIIPLAVLMCVYAGPIISLFRAGNFNTTDVEEVAFILQFWTLSLPFYSVVMYLYNAYASIKKFHIFALVSIIAVVGQCFCYWLFCTQVPLFGLLGIPIADFLFYIASCIVLLIIMIKIVGSINILSIIWTNIRVLFASIIGSLIGFIIMGAIRWGEVNVVNGILQLCICGTISLIIICALCWLFRIKEIRDLFSKLIAKVKRN